MINFARICTDVPTLFSNVPPRVPLMPRIFRLCGDFREWWTHKGSNLGPLPCEGNALPLSYASGNSANYGPSEPAIYEVRASSVKRSIGT